MTGIKKWVVHCKLEPYDIYIGRPSIYGNPFQIGKDGTREEVIQKHKNYILTLRQDLIVQIKKELKEKILGCFCAPLICHGDFLSELANEEI